MCVAFWTLDHPQYALILCSNRDEYLHRPTAPAHWHSFGPINADELGNGSVLSGRDLLAGGTWAGVTRSGTLALLTNITEPVRKYATSRGELVSHFLLPKTSKHKSLQAEIDAFLGAHRDRAYAGFNLLVLEPTLGPPSESEDPVVRGLSFEGAFLTNSGGGGTLTGRMLSDAEQRTGGMSNGIDGCGADEWPKVQHGREALRDLLRGLPRDATEAQIADWLFALLTWTSKKPPADRSELRNTIHVLPLPIPLSGAHATTPAASPTPDSPRACSDADGGAGVTTNGGTPPLALDSDSTTTTAVYYGTRLSTVILIRRDGNATFIERDIWALEQQEQAQAQEEDHEQRTSDATSASASASDADGGGDVPAHPTPKPVPKSKSEPRLVDKRDSGDRDHDRVFRFQIPIPSAR